MIALYAITDHPTPPLPEPGAVRVIANGDLAALCGPVIPGEVTASALWQHERIVEALMDDRDVLPVRYGTCLRDEAAAAQALQDNRARFAATLETVRGAVEVAVRVFPAGGELAPEVRSLPSTGTEYLRARACSLAREGDAAAVVHEPLARAARAATAPQGLRAGELLRAAYLVDRDATESFSARVRHVQQGNPHLRITCTGPWPPYSFVQS